VDVRDTLYIGGEWLPPAGDGWIDVVEPATEEVMGRVPEGTSADADRAVAAARAAFDGWAATPLDERAGWLRRLHEGLVARSDEIGTMIAREVGMPVSMATLVQIGRAHV
jgi:aldehyde dehydrogenase (NAD+)